MKFYQKITYLVWNSLKNIWLHSKERKNLKDHLVYSKLHKRQSGNTKTCNRRKCVTCPHINPASKIVGPKGYFDIKSNFSCVSEGLVYVIECKKCGSLYVGETGRKLGDRFREHRRNVINRKIENEVASHFCRAGHCVEDMMISGVLCVRDSSKRKLSEQKLISKLGSVLGYGMNVDFNFQQLM